MNDSINRRHFLKQTGAAGIGLGLAGYFGSSTNAKAQAIAQGGRTMGSKDKITAAVIGTNGRGLAHVEYLTSVPGVEVACICDVDRKSVV